MEIRLAKNEDISEIERIYDEILELEKEGKYSTGWIKNVYPTKNTILQGLAAKDLYVLENHLEIVASARINNKQMEEYKQGNWTKVLPDNQVLVLHTLTVRPKESGHGYAGFFIEFYNCLAKERNCRSLRIDTNVRNRKARDMYNKLGFEEVGIVPCEFNGIAGVNLVLLERDVM